MIIKYSKRSRYRYIAFIIIISTLLFFYFNYAKQIITRKHIPKMSRIKTINSPSIRIIKNSSIVNIHKYDYLINPQYQICSNKNNLLLFTILTRIDNFDRRQLIRSLWSNHTLKFNFNYVFMIGQSSNETLNQFVMNEFTKYGDIVQENFIDSYYNLTLKTIMSFKWVSKYCSNSVYSVKIDDDVVVNFNLVTNYLNSKRHNRVSKNEISCLIVDKAGVNRNTSSKHYASIEEYSEEFYPSYCASPVYVYQTNLANYLFEISKYVKFFKFEDVYFGLLISKLKYHNITDINMNRISEKYNDIRDISKIFVDGYFNSSQHFFHFHLNTENYIYIFNKIN